VYKSVHGKNHPAKMAGWLHGMKDSKKEAPLRVLPFGLSKNADQGSVFYLM